MTVDAPSRVTPRTEGRRTGATIPRGLAETFLHKLSAVPLFKHDGAKDGLPLDRRSKRELESGEVSADTRPYRVMLTPPFDLECAGRTDQPSVSRTALYTEGPPGVIMQSSTSLPPAASFTLTFPPHLYPLLRAEGRRDGTGLVLTVTVDPTKDHTRLQASLARLRTNFEERGERIIEVRVVTEVLRDD